MDVDPVTLGVVTQQPWSPNSGSQPPAGWPIPPGRGFPTQGRSPWPTPQRSAGYPPQFQGYPSPTGQRPVFAPPPPKKKKNPLRVVFLVLITIGVVTAFSSITDAITDRLFRADRVDSAYQNESYSTPPVNLDPDPIPIPSSQQFESTVTANKFYNQTVPLPVRCDIDDINPARAGVSSQETYLNELTGCLMRVWATAVEDAGWSMPRPSVTVYSSEITTRCGKAPMRNAFYCSADQQLYFASDVLTILPSRLGGHRLALDAILGHEFGHAIQGRTAILAAATLMSQGVSERDASVYQRRLEVQADCLNGMFINSIAQSRQISGQEKQDVASIYQSIGDDILSGETSVWGEHGLGATRKAWAEAGLSSTQVKTCNTFIVPATQVR